jgi:hypothetical protein
MRHGLGDTTTLTALKSGFYAGSDSVPHFRHVNAPPLVRLNVEQVMHSSSCIVQS